MATFVSLLLVVLPLALLSLVSECDAEMQYKLLVWALSIPYLFSLGSISTFIFKFPSVEMLLRFAFGLLFMPEVWVPI